MTTFNHYPKWTKEELEVIRQQYPTEGALVVSKILGRTVMACQVKACLLGYTTKKIYGKSKHFKAHTKRAVTMQNKTRKDLDANNIVKFAQDHMW